MLEVSSLAVVGRRDRPTSLPDRAGQPEIGSCRVTNSTHTTLATPGDNAEEVGRRLMEDDQRTDQPEERPGMTGDPLKERAAVERGGEVASDRIERRLLAP